MTALRLSAQQAAELAALGEAAFPREACALLVGDSTLRVAEIVPAKNVSTDPQREFELDPAVHIAVLRKLRESGGTNRIIGHWHSHPNGRDEPSATDAAMVSDPGLVWLITAVHDGRALPVRAFQPVQQGDDFRFTALAIQQD